MRKIVLTVILLILSTPGFSETLSGYQEKIERVFIGEAANKYIFTKAVQTARLLGYLEFMEPENFSKFYPCMAKEKSWDYLSAQKRQTVLNECRGLGRTISGITVSQPSFSVSPAANQKQEQEMASLRKEIDSLRSMVEKMSSDIRNNQNQLLETLNGIPSRAPSQAVPSIPEQSVQ